uniref:Uncharacterized protein n=1 Tax=viral metagenome TaxID=1070528 RepID=A0A6M3LS26_9ZZZZ
MLQVRKRKGLNCWVIDIIDHDGRNIAITDLDWNILKREVNHLLKSGNTTQAIMRVNGR